MSASSPHNKFIVCVCVETPACSQRNIRTQKRRAGAFFAQFKTESVGMHVYNIKDICA